MESARVPVHLSGGSLLSISDVLATFSENSFVWVLFEFFGTGRAPEGMSMPEFEDRVRSAPDGLQMTWAELKAFGTHVAQTFDCEIAAFRANGNAVTPRDIDVAIAKICAFDSTEWFVAIDRPVEEFRSVLSAVRRIAADAG